MIGVYFGLNCFKNYESCWASNNQVISHSQLKVVRAFVGVVCIRGEVVKWCRKDILSLSMGIFRFNAFNVGEVLKWMLYEE